MSILERLGRLVRSELPTFRRPGDDPASVLVEAESTLRELRQGEADYRAQYQDALDVVQQHDDRAAAAMRASDEAAARAALEDRREALERAEAARRRLETLRQQIAPLDDALRTARARLQTLRAPVIPASGTPHGAFPAPRHAEPTAPSVASPTTTPAAVPGGPLPSSPSAVATNPYAVPPGSVWASAGAHAGPSPTPTANPYLDRAADTIGAATDRIAEIEGRIAQTEATVLLDDQAQDRLLRGAIDDNYRRLAVERLRSNDEPEQDTALLRLRERMRGGPSRD